MRKCFRRIWFSSQKISPLNNFQEVEKIISSSGAYNMKVRTKSLVENLKDHTMDVSTVRIWVICFSYVSRAMSSELSQISVQKKKNDSNIGR